MDKLDMALDDVVDNNGGGGGGAACYGCGETGHQKRDCPQGGGGGGGGACHTCGEVGHMKRDCPKGGGGGSGGGAACYECGETGHQKRDCPQGGGGGGGKVRGGRTKSRSTPYGGGDGDHGGSQGKRVFVGNLSYGVAWQDLKDHMKQAGEVIYCDIIPEPDNASFSKGCGLVEFSSAEEAETAIETLTDTDLKGRSIFVREDRETMSIANATHGGLQRGRGRAGAGRGRGGGDRGGDRGGSDRKTCDICGSTAHLKRGCPRGGGGGGDGPGVCYAFQEGTCERGSSCRFSHDGGGGGRGGGRSGGGGGGGSGVVIRTGGGKNLKLAGGGGGRGGGDQIFIGNLPWTTTGQNLRDVFANGALACSFLPLPAVICLFSPGSCDVCFQRAAWNARM